VRAYAVLADVAAVLSSRLVEALVPLEWMQVALVGLDVLYGLVDALLVLVAGHSEHSFELGHDVHWLLPEKVDLLEQLLAERQV